MSITREEAIAEAQRRGLIPKEEIPSQSITREEALAEAKRRGLIIPQESNNWAENPAMSAIYGIAEPFDKLAHGILQPLLENKNSPEFLRNASQSVGQGNRALNKRSEELNPLSHMFGNIGGEVALNAPAMALGAPGSAGILKSTLGKPGWMGLLSNILRGGIGGGLRGGAEYAGEDESRLENALSKAIGGAAAGALPSALGVAKGAVNYGKNIKNAYPVEKIAKKLVSDRNAIKSQYKSAYKNVFDEASKSGANKINLPNINEKEVLKHLGSKDASQLKEFLKNPTIENANKIERKIGNSIKELESKKSESKIIIPGQNKNPVGGAIDSLKETKSSIRKALNEIVPKANIKDILANTTPKDNKVLREYLKKPTLDNAHLAQSGLGKIIRKLERKSEGIGLAPGEGPALEKAIREQEKIRKSINSRLSKIGRNDLGEKYAEITQGYAKDVIPYTRNKAINAFRKGELVPEDLVRKIATGEKSKANLLPKYPEISARRSFPKVAGALGLSGALGGGAYKLWPYLFGNNE